MRNSKSPTKNNCSMPIVENKKTFRKKNKSAFMKTLTNYEPLRALIRDCYLFGYRSRKDFEIIGLKGRSYDDYKRKLEFCIGERFFESSQTKIKHLKLKADLYHHSYNYLIDTYYLNTITNNFYLNILIMQILSCAKTALSKKDISDKLSILDIDTFDMNAINRCISTLLDYGWISKNHIKGTHTFTVNRNILDDLSLDEIKELYVAINFYKNISFLISPGYYLLKTLENFAFIKFNQKLFCDDLFQYRFLNLSRLLDDQTLFTIKTSINKNKSIIYKKKNSTKTHTVTPTAIRTIYPYNIQKILTTNGSSIRLDSIESLKSTSSSTTYSTKCSKEPSQCLELIFTFTNEDSEPEIKHIQNRILVEASWMTCIQKTNDKWIYMASVYDARSYLPWIRTFHKFVSLGNNTYHQLRKKSLTDKKETLKNYGIIQ